MGGGRAYSVLISNESQTDFLVQKDWTIHLLQSWHNTFEISFVGEKKNSHNLSVSLSLFHWL